MNILIGVPTPENIPAEFTGNVLSLISYTKEHRPDVESIQFATQSGVRTDRNRNIILEQALKTNIDYLLWLDADMLFPADMICKYLTTKFDIIGCLYFKRIYPYDAVAYIKGDNPLKPYRPIHPTDLKPDTVVDLDGLGFGGMMVDMRVYREMRDDKWMRYGANYHLPYETDQRLTHDLEFCRLAQEHGFNICMHTGVKPGHVAQYLVTEKDWLRAREEMKADIPTITVIIPTIHPEQAQQTAQILKQRAGMPCKIIIAEDKEKSGYVATVNEAVKQYPSDYYVYTADDIFPGRNWLSIAYEALKKTNSGLCGFNDGKWQGKVATNGLISHEFMISNYENGNIFFPGYHCHYNDTELTMLAMKKQLYCYQPEAVLTEVDYTKEAKSVNMQDKELFNQRKQELFSDSPLKNQYS